MLLPFNNITFFISFHYCSTRFIIIWTLLIKTFNIFFSKNCLYHFNSTNGKLGLSEGIRFRLGIARRCSSWWITWRRCLCGFLDNGEVTCCVRCLVSWHFHPCKLGCHLTRRQWMSNLINHIGSSPHWYVKQLEIHQWLDLCASHHFYFTSIRILWKHWVYVLPMKEDASTAIRTWFMQYVIICLGGNCCDLWWFHTYVNAFENIVIATVDCNTKTRHHIAISRTDKFLSFIRYAVIRAEFQVIIILIKGSISWCWLFR